jgi:hypothetical protein
MNRKEAREELKKITKQKTVSVSRFNKILIVIDIDGCEKQRVDMAKKIKRMKEKMK